MMKKNPYTIKNPYAKKSKTANTAAAANTGSGAGTGQSSGSGGQVSKQRASAPVTANNPYRSNRKHKTTENHRKQQSASSPTTNTAATSTTAASAATSSGVVVARELEATGVLADTFSQAFGSIEDTEHFQNSVSTLKNGDPNKKKNKHDKQEQLERDQQRTMDYVTAKEAAASIAAAAAATATTTNDGGDNTTAAAASLEDRDYHVYFQQQPHVLYVSTRQRGNGLLRYIRNVPCVFSRMVPDYVMNPLRCALFLSCKYHSLHPQYIHRRIAELKTDFTLRVLLVLVDVDDNANILLHLNKLAVVHNLTLLLSWTEEEAARYLETYKAMDGKDAALIQRKEKNNFVDQVGDFLCGTGGAGGVATTTGINKTDSGQLLAQFSNVRCIVAASMDELGLVPGMGRVKVKRLHDAFHKPFSKNRAKKRRKKMLLEQRQQEQSDPQESPREKSGHSEEEARNCAAPASAIAATRAAVGGSDVDFDKNNDEDKEHKETEQKPKENFIFNDVVDDDNNNNNDDDNGRIIKHGKKQ